MQLQIKHHHHCITTDMTLIHITMLTGRGNTICNSKLNNGKYKN